MLRLDAGRDLGTVARELFPRDPLWLVPSYRIRKSMVSALRGRCPGLTQTNGGPKAPDHTSARQTLGSDLVGRRHPQRVQRVGERGARRRHQASTESPRPRVLLTDDRRGVLVEVAEGRRQAKRIRGEESRATAQAPSRSARADTPRWHAGARAPRVHRDRSHRRLAARTVVTDLSENAGGSRVRVLQVDAGVAGNPQCLVEVEGDDLVEGEPEQVVAHRPGGDQRCALAASRALALRSPAMARSSRSSARTSIPRRPLNATFSRPSSISTPSSAAAAGVNETTS